MRIPRSAQRVCFRAFGLLVILVAAPAARSAGDVTTGQQTPVPFASIAQGSSSGILAPEETAIDSAPDWLAFWARHAPGASPPPVDFAADLVVAVVAGQRPTAGYEVDIVAIERGPAVTTVIYRVRRPPPDALVAQVLTSPFHIVRLPRPGLPIRFERR